MSVYPMSMLQAKVKSTFSAYFLKYSLDFYITWNLCHLYQDKCRVSGLGQYVIVQGHSKYYIIRYAVSFVSLFRTKCVQFLMELQSVSLKKHNSNSSLV